MGHMWRRNGCCAGGLRVWIGDSVRGEGVDAWKGGRSVVWVALQQGGRQERGEGCAVREEKEE